MRLAQRATNITVLALLTVWLVGAAPGQNTKTGDQTADWKAVETAFGWPGKLQPDGTYKFSMPRTDLKVSVNGTPIKAGLALGSWTAFQGTRDHGMVMGDLVLTETEVEPVMMKLQQQGILQTALHNHLLHENPRVLYMHIEGHGDAVQMAKAIHDGLALTRTPAAQPATATSDQNIGIDTAQLDSILGHKGKINGGLYQVSVPRADKITEQGMEVPPSMGTATAINFQPTGSGRAAITGDFVLLANEVNPVIRALRQHGIEVTALHSHMLNEEPRLFFMHFWANDDAATLAKGLRSALDQMKSPAASK